MKKSKKMLFSDQKNKLEKILQILLINTIALT